MNHERPKRRDDLIARALGEETVIYDAEGRTVYVLNTTSQVIWSLCDGEHSIGDMVDALQAQFAIEPRVDVKADVVDTLETLREKPLIA